MADGQVVIDVDVNGKSVAGLNSQLDQLEGSSDKAGFSIKNLAISMGLVKVASAVVGKAISSIKTAFSTAISEGANLQQSLGGIETLFKGSADKVKKYADEAYKTSGLSANAYMENVTSFSASLLQSVGGDTEKAADVANMAMIDMSDNANKMGTNMQDIQNAYQGFAKQNYTMLDNLKLGYGGTKEEMQRLLSDAEKLTGVKYDISNLSDVYNAIHAIQENLDITGTTAKEAAERNIKPQVRNRLFWKGNELDGFKGTEIRMCSGGMRESDAGGGKALYLSAGAKHLHYESGKKHGSVFV